MAALVTVMVAEGEAVAPGNVFEVSTKEEAQRLEEIGAAARIDAATVSEVALATAATGLVVISGVVGATLPAGAVLLVDDGPAYRTTDAVTLIADGSVTVRVLAEHPGSAGNQVAETELLLDEVPDGIEPIATVGLGGLTGGADA